MRANISAQLYFALFPSLSLSLSHLFLSLNDGRNRKGEKPVLKYTPRESNRKCSVLLRSSLLEILSFPFLLNNTPVRNILIDVPDFPIFERLLAYF